MIFWLGTEPNSPFPPLSLALEEPNGLLAAGGDLHPQRLLSAYRRGIFPWYSEEQPILWWCPQPRCVLPVDKFHISRSLRRELRRSPVKITANQSFLAIMQGCATAPGRGGQGSWIVPPMLEAYQELHRLGHAHSIEVWYGGKLAGGLYGVRIGRMFFAESMFTLSNSASKVALLALCYVMARGGAHFIDCQISNPHLHRLGAEEISRKRFIEQVQKHCHLPMLQAWPDQWPTPAELVNEH